jgi:hypothetical protein
LLARLNASQSKVAITFLTSPPGTITIAQGVSPASRHVGSALAPVTNCISRLGQPPGTGKSTLLVSTLLQYVRNRQDGRSRVMICAPTNKAVSIVANRFLKELCEEERWSMTIIATGDRDKLRDRGMVDVLKPYYLATWQKTMALSWEQILNCLSDGTLDEEKQVLLTKEAGNLRLRLVNSLPDLSNTLMEKADSIYEKLLSSRSGCLEPIKKTLRDFIMEFRRLDAYEVRKRLMETATAVFCTLCSSGSKSVSFTKDFDDLIVDEAAAATEPDLYIPFQLHPKRLLIVGDPKQLPSVVLSDRARRLGLDVSLHERLMYGCKYDYIMMNCQYRMHPQIASFPAFRFYENAIENGSNVCHHAYGADSVRLNGSAYVFFQVHGWVSVSDTGVYNHDEANLITELVVKLSNRSTGGNKWQSVNRIRVITFYKEQVALIRKKLGARGFHNIFVGTVDSSQGCESDIVLVSFVRGSTKAGFLSDNRRINVALTRARHQLICVGNVDAMAQLQGATTETLRLLSQDATSRGAVTSLVGCLAERRQRV